MRECWCRFCVRFNPGLWKAWGFHLVGAVFYSRPLISLGSEFAPSDFAIMTEIAALTFGTSPELVLRTPCRLHWSDSCCVSLLVPMTPIKLQVFWHKTIKAQYIVSLCTSWQAEINWREISLNNHHFSESRDEIRARYGNYKMWNPGQISNLALDFHNGRFKNFIAIILVLFSKKVTAKNHIIDHQSWNTWLVISHTVGNKKIETEFCLNINGTEAFWIDISLSIDIPQCLL